jgi:hypothetical protein
MHLVCLLAVGIGTASVACQSSPPASATPVVPQVAKALPTVAPPAAAPPTAPAPSDAPTPIRKQVSFTEEYLSRLGFEYGYRVAHWPGTEVTLVTANVQADGEVYWKMSVDLYAGDTMIEIVPVMGTRVVVENGRVLFELFNLQWLGLQFNPDRLSELHRDAIFGLHEGVSAALDRELVDLGWVPMAVTADDQKITVTVEQR